MHVESWSASVCVSSSLFYVAPRVFVVVSFAFKPRDELSDELRPPFKCKSPGFNCNDCVVKSRKEIEKKQSQFRALTAARQEGARRDCATSSPERRPARGCRDSLEKDHSPTTIRRCEGRVTAT
jgi:hypothetical protein